MTRRRTEEQEDEQEPLERDRVGRDKDVAKSEQRERDARELKLVDSGALVLRSSRGHAWLLDDGGSGGASLPPRAEAAGSPKGDQGRNERHVLLPRWAQVVPGDRVRVDAAGRVDGMVARRTMLRRQVGVKGEQVLAANLDQVALVVAPGPLLREGFLARSICGVIAEKLHPLIVFQKVDVDADHAMAARAGLYAALGFDVIGTSAKSREGVDALKKRFAGKSTAMLGQSGVGKSSLVNVMYGLDLTIGDVDAWGRGRHTTSLGRAIPVGDGALLIDLPGVREFGLAHLEPAVLGAAFPEIAIAARKCRIPGCPHLGEEGCAVEAAVSKGRLDLERFEIYRGIVASFTSGVEGGGRV